MGDVAWYCSRCGEPVHQIDRLPWKAPSDPIWRHTKTMFLTCDDGVLPVDDPEGD